MVVRTEAEVQNVPVVELWKGVKGVFVSMVEFGGRVAVPVVEMEEAR